MNLFKRLAVAAAVVTASCGFGVATAGSASADPLCYWFIIKGITGTIPPTPICVPYSLATICEDTTLGSPAVETVRLYFCVPAP